MSETINNIVIIGGGFAAAKATEAVRNEGFEGAVTLITEEPHRPYERPPLSKSYLIEDKPEGDVHVHSEAYYSEHKIDLQLGDVATEIDRNGGVVRTRAGKEFVFDRLLLATGASPRSLKLSERELDGIVTLRTLDDSRRLAELLRAVDHVTIVGAGWIGCEVAAAARTIGTQVTMVDPGEVPLARVLGPEVGRVFHDLHSDHGVDLRLGLGVKGALGNTSVEQVDLTDGSKIDTQLVVVGVGAIPRTELAEKSGLAVENGVTVDETLVTADPRIFAAGDVANAWHPSLKTHLRVEHWDNALHQGEAAGKNMLGAGEAYDRLPYFFSDQYDLGMEYSGHATKWDRVVFRGNVEAREFIVFWMSNDRVVAGMNVNIWDVNEQVQELIRIGKPADVARLEDTNAPITDLM